MLFTCISLSHTACTWSKCIFWHHHCQAQRIKICTYLGLITGPYLCQMGLFVFSAGTALSEHHCRLQWPAIFWQTEQFFGMFQQIFWKLYRIVTGFTFQIFSSWIIATHFFVVVLVFWTRIGLCHVVIEFWTLKCFSPPFVCARVHVCLSACRCTKVLLRMSFQHHWCMPKSELHYNEVSQISAVTCSQ